MRFYNPDQTAVNPCGMTPIFTALSAVLSRTKSPVIVTDVQ